MLLRSGDAGQTPQPAAGVLLEDDDELEDDEDDDEDDEDDEELEDESLEDPEDPVEAAARLSVR
jgi:hypothetical protein